MRMSENMGVGTICVRRAIFPNAENASTGFSSTKFKNNRIIVNRGVRHYFPRNCLHIQYRTTLVQTGILLPQWSSEKIHATGVCPQHTWVPVPERYVDTQRYPLRWDSARGSSGEQRVGWRRSRTVDNGRRDYQCRVQHARGAKDMQASIMESLSDDDVWQERSSLREPESFNSRASGIQFGSDQLYLQQKYDALLRDPEIFEPHVQALHRSIQRRKLQLQQQEEQRYQHLSTIEKRLKVQNLGGSGDYHQMTRKQNIGEEHVSFARCRYVEVVSDSQWRRFRETACPVSTNTIWSDEQIGPQCSGRLNGRNHDRLVRSGGCYLLKTNGEACLSVNPIVYACFSVHNPALLVVSASQRLSAAAHFLNMYASNKYVRRRRKFATNQIGRRRNMDWIINIDTNVNYEDSRQQSLMDKRATRLKMEGFYLSERSVDLLLHASLEDVCLYPLQVLPAELRLFRLVAPQVLDSWRLALLNAVAV